MWSTRGLGQAPPPTERSRDLCPLFQMSVVVPSFFSSLHSLFPYFPPFVAFLTSRMSRLVQIPTTHGNPSTCLTPDHAHNQSSLLHSFGSLHSVVHGFAFVQYMHAPPRIQLSHHTLDGDAFHCFASSIRFCRWLRRRSVIWERWLFKPQETLNSLCGGVAALPVRLQGRFDRKRNALPWNEVFGTGWSHYHG